MEENKELEEGFRMCPVFCTVDAPTELLDRLITDPEETQTFRIMDLETGDAAAAAPKHPSRAPATAPRPPFLNWSVDAIHTYWKAHFRAPGDGSSTAYTAFNFVVVDAQTLDEHRADADADAATILICSEAPDFEEDVDGPPVLKTQRLSVGRVAEELPALEFLTACPSELDAPMRMSVMPPPSMAGGGPDGMRRAKALAIQGIPKGVL